MPMSTGQQVGFVVFVTIALGLIALFIGALFWADTQQAPQPVAVPQPPPAYVVLRYAHVYQGGLVVVNVRPEHCEATAEAMGQVGAGPSRVDADCVIVEVHDAVSD